MTTLPALLERVRAATGPDRELDLLIWKLLVWKTPWNHELHKTELFTRSIDAALALVERMLPGAFDSVGKDEEEGGHWWAADLLVDNIWHSGVGPTIPLAILAALLSALIDKAPTP